MTDEALEHLHGKKTVNTELREALNRCKEAADFADMSHEEAKEDFEEWEEEKQKRGTNKWPVMALLRSLMEGQMRKEMIKKL